MEVNNSSLHKLIVLIFLAFFLNNQVVFAQKLSLFELEKMCAMKQWESVNNFLNGKKWEYYESSKGDSDNYNTITWSFEKSYDDKASAWFYLYTYEGFPNKIAYSVFNKSSYNVIQNAIGTKGYKIIGSEIEDDQLISTYANSKYILKVRTTKRQKNDYSYSDESITAYSFELIKKSSVYDPNNGIKIDYNDDGIKEVQYTLKNGKLDGPITWYFDDGVTIKKEGQFREGKKEGHFKDYDKQKQLLTSYYYKNDELSGLVKVYEDGKLSEEKNYKDNELDGNVTYYYYSDDDALFAKQKGGYKNGLKEGIWNLFGIEEGKDKLLSFENYKAGKREGAFQDAVGDSLVIGKYKSDQLHGGYRVYYDFKRMLIGGFISTDTTNLKLIVDGNYSNGEKEGYWKNYHLTGNLASEGNYSEDLEHGEWKYYYAKMISSENEEPLHYSEDLYLTENYDYGYLSGPSQRFSYLQEQKYPCDDTNNDSCIKKIYRKIDLLKTYKDNKLHGKYILRDSLNRLLIQGNYENDNKEGLWIERINLDIKENLFYYEQGNYKNNLRTGEWISYFTEDEVFLRRGYKEGELHGDYLEYDVSNKPSIKKVFNEGDLKEVYIYKDNSATLENHYKILKEVFTYYKVRRTSYKEDGSKIIEDFYITKTEEDKPKIAHNDIKRNLPLKIELDKEDNYPDGIYKEYDAKGRVIVEGTLLKEKPLNDWNYYFYDVNVKMTIKNKGRFDPIQELGEFYSAIDTGKPFDGVFVYFDKKTGNKEERKVKDGLRHGLTIVYDENGNKINKIKYKEGVIK